jgi:putative nucleotidyltransferase with HDIG domain
MPQRPAGSLSAARGRVAGRLQTRSPGRECRGAAPGSKSGSNGLDSKTFFDSLSAGTGLDKEMGFEEAECLVEGSPMPEHAVLFVDDEVNILRSLQRLLKSEPVTVRTATRASEALEILAQHPTQVVVSDQRMPDACGVDLLEVIRERHPEVIRLMLTGFTEIGVAVDAVNRGQVYRLITKPWNDDELRSTLRQAFDHWDLKFEIQRLARLTREQNAELQDLNRNLEAMVRERTKQLAQKNQELRDAYIQTIRALAEAVDAKDSYTRGHSERVGVYASKIARELNFPKAMIERVYIAGLLHDVGKIGVPDAVIAKPDKLTDAEYEEIKKHPEIGARILEPVRFLADVVPCVRHHHEWFDGSDRGYPLRLKGDQIPIASRVILVADTVEAMTSDRPYRKGLPLERVVAEVHKFSGTQFDPICADAFLRILEREGERFIRRDQKFDIYAFIEG